MRTRCPHGRLIDTAFEQSENRELKPLDELEPGSRAEIVWLAEHDGALLHWYYDEGLVPGTTIELQVVQEAAGQFALRVNGSERAIAEKAAAGLYVRPEWKSADKRSACSDGPSFRLSSYWCPRPAAVTRSVWTATLRQRGR